jgi:hypothetical protein
MNKLREKFEHEILTGDELYFITLQLEQITDDFTCQFVKWYNLSKYDFPNEMTIEEKQQYFKENVYGK